MLEKTTTDIKNVYEDSHIFPAVTICNLNAFSTYPDSNAQYIGEILMEHNFSLPLNVSNSNYESATKLLHSGLDILKANVKKRVLEVNLTSSELLTLGFDIDTMLVSCTYARKVCEAKDFSYSYSFEYGNCYTFNADFYKNSTVVSNALTGSTASLELELFAGIGGYLKVHLPFSTVVLLTFYLKPKGYMIGSVLNLDLL